MPVEFSDLVLNDFSGGLNLRDSPASLKQNELFDAFNFIVTDEGQLQTRPALWPVSSLYESSPIESLFHWNQIGTNNDFVFYVTAAGDLRGLRFTPIYEQGGEINLVRFRRHLSNMLVGDNSDFENDVGNWTTTSTYPTITRDTGTKYAGAASMKLDYVGTGGGAQCFTAAQYASCARLADGRFSKIGQLGAWVYLPSTNTGAQTVNLDIYQYNSGGTQIGFDSQTYDLSLTEDQWVWCATNEGLTASSSYLRVVVGLAAEAAGDVMYVDNVFLSATESWDYTPADLPSFYSTRGALDDPAINIGTLPADELPGIAWTVFNDVLYVTTNGYTSDEVWKFDGSTWTQITDQNLNGTGNEFPFAKFLVNKHERLFAFNVDHSAGPHRSRLWYSEPGDPVTWGSLSWIDVDPDDGSEITGAVSFADGIVIFKDHSVFYLSGVDENSFTLFPVQQGIGCQSPNTIQVVENQVIWFDATRGWFAFDGANILPISDKISSAVIEELYWDPASVKHAASFVHRNQYYCSVPVNRLETRGGAPESNNNQLTYSLNIRNGAWSRHSFGFRTAANIDGIVYLGSITNVGLDLNVNVELGLWHLNPRVSSDWRCEHVAQTTFSAPLRPTAYIRTGLIRPGSLNDSFKFVAAGSSLTGGDFGRVYASFDSIDHVIWQSDLLDAQQGSGPFQKFGARRMTGQPSKFRGLQNWLPEPMAKGPDAAYINVETNCTTTNEATDYVYAPSSLKITRTGTGSANWSASWGAPITGDTVLQIPGWAIKTNLTNWYWYLDFWYKVVAGTISTLTFNIDIYDEEWTYLNEINWAVTPTVDGAWHRTNWNDSTITERSFPFVPSRYRTYLFDISFDGTTTSDTNVVLVNSPWFSPTLIDLQGFNTFNSLSLGLSLGDPQNGGVWGNQVTVDSLNARFAQRGGPRSRYSTRVLET